jgi:RNA polymerase sigma-70 factor (ECF subfamily)
MADAEITDGLRDAARAAWHGYLDGIAPFRPELYRYCRRLAGNVWDAEDLVQETLLKGFASLGAANATIDNPRGYLVRIATHLFIDARRRQQTEAAALAATPVEVAATPTDRGEIGDASRRLFEALAPQERAAVVLKDVFDLSLAEIAETLSTSVGAVKAALHRGRARLKDEAPTPRQPASPALVEAFMRKLDASDLPGLLALMLDTGSIEMPGALVEVGRREFQRKGSWLWQSVNVHPELPPEMRPPKWVNARVEFEGEPIILGFMPTPEGRLLQGITRFEEADGKIARIRSYCFSPEMAAEIAAALGLAVGWIPYRFPTELIANLSSPSGGSDSAQRAER